MNDRAALHRSTKHLASNLCVKTREGDLWIRLSREKFKIEVCDADLTSSISENRDNREAQLPLKTSIKS